MFVSRYIALLLSQLGIKHVFGITGTAVNLCFVALGEQDGIDYICPLHEQAASMGADGYSRVSRSIGVALGTCGPGTTNMITGCAGAYTDSIPVLYLFGQVSGNTSKRDDPIRFFGFQEIDTVSILKPITKYVKQLSDASEIRYEIEKAIHIACSNRKGPTALVIPEDILYAEIKQETLLSYPELRAGQNPMIADADIVKACYEDLKRAKRPVLLLGSGIHSANAEEAARELAQALCCPVAMSYPVRDLFDDDNKLNVGSIGIFGSRGGNKALQNADYLLGIGVRFDRYVTGKPLTFARNAKKVVVDIDENELNKWTNNDLDFAEKIQCDANCFLRQLLKLRADDAVEQNTEHHRPWVNAINEWKNMYPLCPDEYDRELQVNPYVFMRELSEALTDRDTLFSDTGLSSVWIGQAFRFKKGQRWFMQFSNSSMGYALPAAIGGSFASEGRMICITGDGGLQMSIQELSTVGFYHCNVKLFVICNEGYGLIQKTQDDFNNGHYATDRDNHVPLPDSAAVANAYGLQTFSITENQNIREKLREVLDCSGPAFCSVHIPIAKKITPRVKGNRAIDNMYPYLD